MNKEKVEERLVKILGGDAGELVSYAEQLGQQFAPQHEREKQHKLSSSQIRNILDEVQRMKGIDDAQLINQLHRLRPKIAYAAGKTRQGNSLRQLQYILDLAIQKTDTKEKFYNFKEFFEAIVGYHRYHSKVREA